MDENQKIALLKKFTDCQKVGPPYQGWDLNKLEIVRVEIANASLGSADTSETTNLLLGVLECLPGTAIHITKLNVEAVKARTLLNLMSVEDLNPEIKRMREAAQNSEFFNTLNLRRGGLLSPNEKARLFLGDLLTPDAENLIKLFKAMHPDERNTLIDSVIFDE